MLNKDTTTSTPPSSAPPVADKSLHRTKDGRMLAGVCSGTGAYLGIDPNLIRIALAVFTIFGGAGIAVYAVGWLLMPEEGASNSVAQDLMTKWGDKNSGGSGTGPGPQ